MPNGPAEQANSPFHNHDSRYFSVSIAELDSKLDAAGMASGLDVWEGVVEAYAGYLGGNIELAMAQLASLQMNICLVDLPVSVRLADE